MRSDSSLSHHAKVSIRHVESVLRRWDPLGVLSETAASGGPLDEYDSYAPQIVGLLGRGAAVDEVASHLERIRAERIGLPPLREVDERFAQELVAWWLGR